MGFVDYLRTKGMKEGQRLLLIAEDAAQFELPKEYKKLTNEGVFEVILFNSISVLNVFKRNHPTNCAITESHFNAALFLKAKKVLKTSDEEVVDFLNSRIRFYNKELNNIYEIKGHIPGKLYSVFYLSPLVSIPEDSFDLMQIVVFFKGLTSMMNWVDQKANAFEFNPSNN